nr:unnamed protein product [Callosobruchus chinensis]
MKLLEGLEYTVELQKSLLKCNEGNKSISFFPSVNHLQPGSSTSSEALKKPKINNSSVLLRKANNDVSDTDALHDITTSFNPAQINACIDNTRTIKNGLMSTLTRTKHSTLNILFQSLRISPDLRKIILKKRYLYVGWKKCEVSDHINILRCSKCCGYGHTAKNCNLELVCGKCAHHHKLADCQSTSELYKV